MRIISYIPIRSGSRGIKDKNILNLAGKPLFAWSVFFAKELSKTGDIIVSSDSDHYLQIALKYNINIEKRPQELASDSSSTESAMLYTLNRLIRNGFIRESDYFCLLQATSPIRRKKLASEIKKLLESDLYDSIISVNNETSFQWMYDLKNPNYIKPKYELRKRPMRQEIFKHKKERIIENGSFYCSRVSSIINSKLRVSGKIGYVTCNDYERLEIDSQDQHSVIDSILTFEMDNNNLNNLAC